MKNNLEGTFARGRFSGDFASSASPPSQRGTHLLLALVDQHRGPGRGHVHPSARPIAVDRRRVLAVHGCNVDLCRGHDDLLLSFVRSLVSSLDARTPTRAAIANGSP